MIESISLKRGERFVGGQFMWLRANRGGRGEGNGVGMSGGLRISTVMGLMFD